MNWKTEATWLCVDVETTGLDPRRDRIVSVAAARKLPGQDTLKLREWLVDPGVPIPEEATRIHGIADADVRGAPTIAEVGSELLRVVERAQVLVGYNWPFDDKFLLAGLEDAWEDATEGVPVVDVLTLVRLEDVGRYWKGKGRHKLANAARQLGVQLPPDLRAHQARADCWLTMSMLRKLLGCLPDDAREADEMVRRERAAQDDQFQSWLAKQKAREEQDAPDPDPSNGHETAGEPPHHY